MRETRKPVRAVLLDAGGVLVLPHRGLVAEGLKQVGIEIDPANVPRAHYAAVRAIDSDATTDGYFAPFAAALGIKSLDTAVEALRTLADRSRSHEILWSEPAPHAIWTIEVLQRRKIAVVIVTNSDGHGAENLRDSGFDLAHVVDSKRVGHEKPDPKIFELALKQAHATPDQAVHVGDMLSTDIAGAKAANLTPIHLDPYRRCRAKDHRHVRSLAGIWQHIS